MNSAHFRISLSQCQVQPKVTTVSTEIIHVNCIPWQTSIRTLSIESLQNGNNISIVRTFILKNRPPRSKAIENQQIHPRRTRHHSAQIRQILRPVDQLIENPLVSKHISWFTYSTIALVIILVILYVTSKCRKKKAKPISIISGPGPPLQPPPSKGLPVFRRFEFVHDHDSGMEEMLL